MFRAIILRFIQFGSSSYYYQNFKKFRDAAPLSTWYSFSNKQ